MKNILKVLGIITFVTAIVLSITACGRDNGEETPPPDPGGPTALGKVLILDEQVYTDVSAWDGGSWVEDYNEYTGTYSINARIWWNGTQRDLGGYGNITDGKLDFVISKPAFLLNAPDLFDEIIYTSDYDDVDVTPSSAKAVYLSYLGAGRCRYIETQDTATAYAYYGEDVIYVYVDKDVTVSGKGKTFNDNYTSGGVDYEDTYITKNFTLNLKEGWNTLYSKYECSGTEVNPTLWKYNASQTISLYNPSNVKWIY